MPAFSIIIPAYNEEKYIEKTLESLQRQTYTDFETIVVTNGCTDRTEDLIRNIIEKDTIKKNAAPNIRHLSLPHPHVSVARNAGALNATGELLVFLDADTLLEPDALQKIQAQFQKQHSIASTKSRPDERKLLYQITFMLKNFYQHSFLYQGCSGALICRKEDFHAVGGYNPELKVREHRKLILALKQRGKFTTIDTAVTTSTRRFQQWGLGRTFFFWIGQWVKDKVGDLKKSEYEKVR